ncbi:hypothetical protein TSAR_009618, partial [Trichomalopsis sarcophagae]
ALREKTQASSSKIRCRQAGKQQRNNLSLNFAVGHPPSRYRPPKYMRGKKKIIIACKRDSCCCYVYTSTQCEAGRGCHVATIEFFIRTAQLMQSVYISVYIYFSFASVCACVRARARVCVMCLFSIVNSNSYRAVLFSFLMYSVFWLRRRRLSLLYIVYTLRDS